MPDMILNFKYKTVDGKEGEISTKLSDFPLKFLEISTSKLKHVSIHDCCLVPDKIAYIFPLLGPCLTHLYVSNLGIDTKCMKSFVPQLDKTNIEVLDLSGNPLADTSGWILSEFISNNNTLKCLFLANCSLTEQGVWPILNSCAVKDMTVIDISKNEFNFAGAGYICSFLEMKPKLSELYMRKCELAEVDVLSILDVSKKCSEIQIFLEGNTKIKTDSVPVNVHM